MKKQVVVNIADMKISNNQEEILVTYSLGSCVAVVLYDPFQKVGGMIHIMLPQSNIEKDRENMNPFKFVDTGVPLLFKEMFKLGCKRNNIIVKVMGGSNVMDKNKFFNIGERNYVAVRKILWKNNILIKKEDVGGVKSRTVRLDVETGLLKITSGPEEYEL